VWSYRSRKQELPISGPSERNDGPRKRQKAVLYGAPLIECGIKRKWMYCLRKNLLLFSHCQGVGKRLPWATAVQSILSVELSLCPFPDNSEVAFRYVVSVLKFTEITLLVEKYTANVGTCKTALL
jgi:hypothetical protein